MLKFVFLLLIQFSLHNAYGGECDAYTVLEEQYQCGDSGYPLRFGQKYCQKFIDKRQNFSPEGQMWLAQVRECLITEANSISAIDCRELKKLAFESHGECYERTGFCDLSTGDRRELYKMIVPQFWRVRLIVDGLNLLKRCRD
tara:strand:- start:8557 stop:8985 length:429 start_codon:yes stop_codon:yes gene_type:complete